MRLTHAALLMSALLLAGCEDAPSGEAALDPLPAPARAPEAAPAPKLPASPAAAPTRAPQAPQDRPRIDIASRGGESAQPTPTPQDLLPLSAILAIARKQVPGEIIDVDLDDDDGSDHYEIEVLTAEGRHIEIRIDARSGRILEIEED